MYYRLKKGYRCRAVQYTPENDARIIAFANGSAAFKQVFNAKTKDFEYQLILTDADGRDTLIPLGSYLAQFEDDNFKVFSEEEFNNTFIEDNKICQCTEDKNSIDEYDEYIGFEKENEIKSYDLFEICLKFIFFFILVLLVYSMAY